MTTLIASADVLAVLPLIGSPSAADLSQKATAAAENYCGRPLTLAVRDEEYMPGTTRIIRLKGYPVQAIDRICTDLTGVLTIVAQGTPWRATVALVTSDGTPQGTPSAVALTTVSGGLTSRLLVPFVPGSGPALATVGQLAAAINALGGWTATVAPGMGSCPTSELRPTAGGLGAVGRPVSLLAYLTTVEDYELKPGVGRVTWNQIRPEAYAYPNRTFGCTGPATKVRVVYTAGWNGDPSNGPVTTPPDLAEACLQIAKAILDCRQISGVIRAASLGNTSYTAGTVAAIPDSARGLLSRYVDRRF